MIPASVGAHARLRQAGAARSSIIHGNRVNVAAVTLRAPIQLSTSRESNRRTAIEGLNYQFSRSTQGLRGVSERWPNLQELLEGEGSVNIGHIPPDHNAAVALEGRHVHAMLRIGEEESLVEILDRLDSAVAKAVDHGISIDEINL